ncbi:MAG: hypothetical protein K940chlam9_01570 [Chlamydiae bacterium]|nr:hypothetical protein [Chlamydiota bacterium]
MLNRTKSLLLLLMTKGVGRERAWKWIREFGSPEQVVEAGFDLKKGLLFEKWEVQEWEKELEIAEKEGISLLAYSDPAYPPSLLKLPDFPLLLYVKGSLMPEDFDGIALIGTRNATLYGKEATFRIAKELAAYQVSVISGLARGIDTAAHSGALEGGGRTIGVIGSGLLNLYPRENLLLAGKIAERGAVISELPLHTPPARGQFPRRNRLISGLSKGVCLLESPLQGGGMLTMGMAKEQGKECYALPGRVDWPTFAGNHLLLKGGQANLIERGEDLLGPKKMEKKRNGETRPNLFLTEEEKAFLEKIPKEEKSIEELVLLTQLPMMKLNVLLTRLVLKKILKEFPGKIYKRNI